MRLVALGFIGVVVGCASVQSSETVTNVPLPPSVQNERVEDSLEHAIKADVHDEYISLVVEQAETCATITRTRTHRYRTITRTADPTVSRTTWAVALLGLGGGAYGYFNAEALSMENTGTTESTDQYRQYGAGAMAVGVLAAVVGVIDGIRASDSDFDDGVIRGESNREESACHQRRTKDVDVDVALASGYTVTGRLDNRGRVDVSLLAVPEKGIPDANTPITASLSGHTIHVELSLAQRESLRASLRSNPRSRMAIDLETKRRKDCEQAVADARQQTPAEPAEVDDADRTAWVTARVACDDLWTSALDAELAIVDQRIVSTTCERRLVQVASSISGEASLDEIATELVSIGDTCTSPKHVSATRQLAGKVLALAKRQQQQQAEETRRIGRQQARAAQQSRWREQQSTKRQQSWGSARLLCNDGTLSPSCTCGRGSYRGCCSWHGGVNRCSAD